MNKKRRNNRFTDTLKNKLRNQFVHGVVVDGETTFPTLDNLITKNKLAKSTVYKFARENNWKQQKDEFYAEYCKKLDKKRAYDMSVKSKKIDDHSLLLSEGFFKTIAIELDKHKACIDKGRKGLSPQHISSLAQALSITQKVAKLALGEATHNIDATVSENNQAFKRAMELLDSVEDSRSRDIQTTH